jgi:hypothetical protein
MSGHPTSSNLQPDVSSARECSRPVRLKSPGVDRNTGELVAGPSAIYMPCGTRRASRCPACAKVYNGDAFQLLRLGLLQRHTNGALPLFVTLTAPGAKVFGTNHHFRARSGSRHCPCGTAHADGDDLLGAPIKPAAFRYDRAVAWNAAAPELWRRFTVNLRRAFPDHDIEYARVIEFQRRGLVHVHAVVRIQVREDGPSRPLPHLTTAQARIRKAAADVSVTTDGLDVPATWGSKTDVRPIVTKQPRRRPGESVKHYEARCRRSTDGQGAASYVAKYATKSPEDTLAGTTGALRSHLTRLHDRAWAVASPKWRGRANIAEVREGHNPTGDEWSYRVRMGRARTEAAAYGYGGQVLTKSRNYSTTFKALRDRRRTWALDARRAAGLPVLSLVWAVEGFGYLPTPDLVADDAGASAAGVSPPSP